MHRRQFLAGSASAAAVAFATAPWPAWAQAPADAGLRAVLDRIFDGDMLLSPQSMTSLGLDTGRKAWVRSRLDWVGPALEAAQALQPARCSASSGPSRPRG